MTYCLWYSDLEGQSSHYWGADAKRLSTAERSGVVIAPGFVISSQVQEELFTDPGTSVALKSAFKGVTLRAPNLLHAACQDARKLITKVGFSKGVEIDFKHYFAQLRDHLVAADSTPLNLTLTMGEHTLTKEIHTAAECMRLVRAIYALELTEEAVLHRLQTEQGIIPQFKAVLIQVHEAAEFSGTAICFDPNTHDEHTIVIAARHQSVPVHPNVLLDDLYRVDRTSLLLLSREISTQWWSHDGKGGHVSPRYLGKENQVLSDSSTQKMARIARNVQALFSEDVQEIHWVYAHKRFFVTHIFPYVEPVIDHINPDVLPLLNGVAGGMGVAHGPVLKIEATADHKRITGGEVVIVESLHPHDGKWLAGVAAVICETGTYASSEGQLARRLGVPVVLAVANARSLLKDGQMITVNGTLGQVFAGSNHGGQVKAYTSLTTGTKIVAVVDDPFLADVQLLKTADGIGLLRGEFIIRMLGVHPQDVLRRNQAQEYSEILAEGLEIAVRAMHPKPVIYQLHDLASADLLGLRPRHLDRHEANPLLGYRGTHRLLSEPELLDLELAALLRLVHKGFTGLQVMIPMARTLEELDRMMSYLLSSPLFAECTLPIWAKCETPALLIQMDQLLQRQLAGICLDVTALSQLIVGIDRENQQVGHQLNQTDSAVQDALLYAIASCREAHIASSIVADGQELRPETIQAAIQAGVTTICVQPSLVGQARTLTASVEQKLVLDYLTAEY